MSGWPSVPVSRSRVQASNLRGVPLPRPVQEYWDNIKEGDLKQLDAAVDELKKVANAARKRLRKGSR